MSDYLEKLTKECIEKKIPVLGGNVSLYNATDNKSINPSILLSINLSEYFFSPL